MNPSFFCFFQSPVGNKTVQTQNKSFVSLKRMFKKKDNVPSVCWDDADAFDGWSSEGESSTGQ